MHVEEFPLGSTSANLARIVLSGRYPEEGTVINTVSEMVIYVLEGSVTLEKDGIRYSLSSGEVVVIKTGEPYSWTPRPSVTLLVFSTPPWTKEQQEVR